MVYPEINKMLYVQYTFVGAIYLSNTSNEIINYVLISFEIINIIKKSS